MSFAAIAFGAALTVAYGALEQGAAQDVAGFWETLQKTVPFTDDLLLIH
jgi:hypothetical protein